MVYNYPCLYFELLLMTLTRTCSCNWWRLLCSFGRSCTQLPTGSTLPGFISCQFYSRMSVWYSAPLWSSSWIHLVFCIVKHVPAWVPFTDFHRFARHGRQVCSELHEKPFSIVKSKMVDVYVVDRSILTLLVFSAQGGCPTVVYIKTTRGPRNDHR